MPGTTVPDAESKELPVRTEDFGQEQAAYISMLIVRIMMKNARDMKNNNHGEN